MNIFLPFESFKDCAQTLDDKRLTKQILECKQILDIILKKKADETYKSPYLNHPVVKHYFNQEHYIVEYALAMCKEFTHRFGKTHTYHSWFIVHMTPKENEFIPFYAEGSKNSIDCIRETDANTVYALFKLKLHRKWLDDVFNHRHLKWTNRNRPDLIKEK